MIPEPRSPNRERLIRTARRLEPMLEELVFVGAQMVELLVTDQAAVRSRHTDDVDVVVAVSTKPAYHRIQVQLHELGFQPDSGERAPLCRFRTVDGLILDAMPLDESVLGFSNRWYQLAIQTAQPVELEPGLTIRVVNAPTFLATKWEAYRMRGRNYPIMSRDIQDIVTVVAGRPSIADELRIAPDDLRGFVAASTEDFLRDPSSDEAIADSLPDARTFPGLVNTVIDRLRSTARL